MENKICEMCNKEFQYELKPGYPRKYCPACSTVRKAAFELNQKVAPQPTAQEAEAKPQPSREHSIVAQCLTKCCAEINKMCPSIGDELVRKSVLDDYNFFLKNL